MEKLLYSKNILWHWIRGRVTVGKLWWRFVKELLTIMLDIFIHKYVNIPILCSNVLTVPDRWQIGSWPGANKQTRSKDHKKRAMLLSKKNFIESKCLFESSFWEIPFREILNFEPFDIFVNGLDETNFSQNFFQRSICLFLYLFLFLFYIFFFFIFLFFIFLLLFLSIYLFVFTLF